MPRPVFFVVAQTGRTKRQQELERSKARAHAASVSYRLRKGNDRRAKHQSSGVKNDTTAERQPANLVIQAPEGAKLDDIEAQLNLLASTSMQTAVTQHKRNPFYGDDLPGVPPIFYDFAEYVYNVIWPNIIYDYGTMPKPMDPMDWKRYAVDHPAAHHSHHMTIAQMAAGAIPDPRLQKVFITLKYYHRQRALEFVRRAINGDTSTNRAGLVSAVLTLAIHNGDWDARSLPEAHPTSPLARGYSLDRNGRVCPVRQHVQAAIALINNIGGASNIHHTGLVEILHGLQVLMFAWHDTRVPTVMVRSPEDTTPLIYYGSYCPDAQAAVALQTLGSGFDVFQGIRRLSGLHRSLLQLREITVALDQYQRSNQGVREWRALVRARVIAQQNLLILPESRPAAVGQQGLCIYRVCLLGALIYSDMVTCPTPNVTGLQPRLAGQLREALEVDKDPEPRHRGLVLWVTLLGAIAASFTPNRGFFLEQLRYLARILRVESFVEFNNLMTTFLWWDPVLGKPASAAWLEKGLFEPGPVANVTSLGAAEIPAES